MNQNTALYDAKGNVVRSMNPNLDPYFFVPMVGGENLSANDITKNPYKYHAWTFRCVNVIMTNLSPLPKILKNKKTDEIVQEHDVLSALTDNPNEYMSGENLWQAIIAGLMLPDNAGAGARIKGGTVFLIADSGKPTDNGRVNLKAGEIPKYFYPYTEKQVSPATTERNGIRHLTGWNLTLQNNKKRHYKPENLIRIYQFNPSDWLSGISNYMAAQTALAQDIRSDIYNSTFFGNNAVPAGVLKAKQNVSPEQLRTAMRMFYENYGGPGKSNRVAGLPYEVDYEHIGFSHRDMQYGEQKRYNKEQIISAFGLNKIAIGDYEQINRATIEFARKMLWTDTYIPINQLIWGAINGQWIRYVDDGIYRGCSDYSGVEALREKYTEKAKAAGTMVREMDFTPALAARMNHIPLTEDDLKKYPWLDERPEKGGTAQLFSSDVPPAKRTTVQRGVDEDQKDDTDIEINTENDEWTKRSWDYINKVLDPGEKRLISITQRNFNIQRNEVLNNIDQWHKDNEIRSELLMRDFTLIPESLLFAISDQTNKSLKMIKPYIVEHLKRIKSKLENELDGLIEWDLKDEKIQKFVSNRVKEYRGIHTVTFKRCSDEIGTMLKLANENNWTPQQFARELKNSVSDVYKIRNSDAKRIARTENGIVSSEARIDAFQDEGIEFHQWLNAADERVRPNHRHKSEGGVGGVIVRVGETFPVVNLKHPNDPTGALSEFINCRCVAVYSEKGE